MEVDEVYAARVEMQRYLDELFPVGTHVNVLSFEAQVLRPVGIAVTVGRVFCSDAVKVDDVWVYELFIDPRDGTEQEYVQPFRAWITDFDLQHLFAEAVIITNFERITVNDDEQLLVIRLQFDPQGQRSVKEGQRAFVTELRESELFPLGFHVEVGGMAGG